MSFHNLDCATNRNGHVCDCGAAERWAKDNPEDAAAADAAVVRHQQLRLKYPPGEYGAARFGFALAKLLAAEAAPECWRCRGSKVRGHKQNGMKCVICNGTGYLLK